MTPKRAAKAVDPFEAMTPAYRYWARRFRDVIDRVHAHIRNPHDHDLDLSDVEELQYVYETALEIERQMRRYQKEATTKGG